MDRAASSLVEISNKRRFLHIYMENKDFFTSFQAPRLGKTNLPPLFKRKGNKRSRVKKKHKEKKLAPNRNKLPFEKRQKNVSQTNDIKKSEYLLAKTKKSK